MDQMEKEKALKDSFDQYHAELLTQRRNDLSDQILHDYKEDFISQLGEHHICTKIITKHGFDHKIIVSSFDRYLRQKLLSAQELDFAVFKKSLQKEV